MDAQTMLRTATILLCLTAAGGLLMAGIRFAAHRNPPSWVAMLHGLLASSGVTLLLYVGVAAGMPAGAWLGLALLGLAALGGLALNLAYHWKDKALAAWLVIVHGLVAAVGLADLLIAVWT